MSLVKSTTPRTFTSPLQQAFAEAGSCLGQVLAKVVVAEIDDNYMGLEQPYRTGLSPKLFSVELIEVRNVGIVKIEGEDVVAFNADDRFVFSPASLMNSGSVVKPIEVARSAMEQKANPRYFINPQDAYRIANQLNQQTIDRMVSVSNYHKKLAETAMKVSQANASYGKATV